MFDFLRNITKSAEEKRQERLNAFLDNALSQRERQQFERELVQDPALRADLEQLRWIKRNVQQLPRVRAPRNFILDPAVHKQQVKQRARKPSWQPYPALRVATALTAFFFILALALDLATPYGALNQPLAGTSQTVAEDSVTQEETLRQADESAMASEADAPEAFEVTRAVTEEVVEEEAAEMAPFTAAEETEVADVAEGAAADVAANEDLENEESVLEEPRPAMPTVATPSTTVEAAGEVTATGEIAALSPQPSLTPQEEGIPLIVVTETPAAVEAPAPVDEDAQELPAAPFPYLLAIEIVLGMALAALVVVMLIVRRGV